jgi:hypothetical protein
MWLSCVHDFVRGTHGFLGEVLWRVLRIANWMRLVCCSSTLLCSFSFVCKDAVMGPDHDPALVLVSVEG